MQWWSDKYLSELAFSFLFSFFYFLNLDGCVSVCFDEKTGN